MQELRFQIFSKVGTMILMFTRIWKKWYLPLNAIQVGLLYFCINCPNSMVSCNPTCIT
jgi:hypothetical protein